MPTGAMASSFASWMPRSTICRTAAREEGELRAGGRAGDFGKPRPALVIQSDRFDEHATVTVLLVSSTRIDAL